MTAQHDAGICGMLDVGDELTAMEGPSTDDGVFFDAAESKFTAFVGTKFNPDSRQHMEGSDAMRYAIGIQMARDRKDFATADKIRAEIFWQYRVSQDDIGTTLQLNQKSVNPHTWKVVYGGEQ